MIWVGAYLLVGIANAGLFEYRFPSRSTVPEVLFNLLCWPVQVAFFALVSVNRASEALLGWLLR